MIPCDVAYDLFVSKFVVMILEAPKLFVFHFFPLFESMDTFNIVYRNTFISKWKIFF